MINENISRKYLDLLRDQYGLEYKDIVNLLFENYYNLH